MKSGYTGSRPRLQHPLVPGYLYSRITLAARGFMRRRRLQSTFTLRNVTGTFRAISIRGDLLAEGRLGLSGRLFDRRRRRCSGPLG